MRILNLLHWDPFEGIPTKEEYLARRAYMNLIRITDSIPNDKKLNLRREIAKDLIDETDREGNRKQAMEMRKVFQRELFW